MFKKECQCIICHWPGLVEPRPIVCPCLLIAVWRLLSGELHKLWENVQSSARVDVWFADDALANRVDMPRIYEILE